MCVAKEEREGDKIEREVRERTREIETATVPTPAVHADCNLKAVNELKKNLNDSLELFSDKLLQLEEEVAELKQRPIEVGVLTENDLLKVVGIILGNDKLAEYLGQKLRDKFKDKVKVNFEIS